MRPGVAGVAVLLAATASGGIEHTILYGASVGQVRAWVGPDELPGLTQSELQRIAEAHLSQGGVRVDPSAESTLFVSATVTLTLPGACFVHLEGRFVEPARLNRNGHAVRASTWSRGGEAASKSLEECAHGAVKTAEVVVGDFVEHYRAMNPVSAGH